VKSTWLKSFLKQVLTQKPSTDMYVRQIFAQNTIKDFEIRFLQIYSCILGLTSQKHLCSHYRLSFSCFFFKDLRVFCSIAKVFLRLQIADMIRYLRNSCYLSYIYPVSSTISRVATQRS
jgi:hypothetical protein